LFRFLDDIGGKHPTDEAEEIEFLLFSLIKVPRQSVGPGFAIALGDRIGSSNGKQNQKNKESFHEAIESSTRP
jgi:hypothetical protein